MATFIYFIIKMGDFIMKKVLLASLIVASLVISGCGGVSSNKYTLEKYNKIQTGMTYEQVKDIMGDPGQPSAESKIPAIEGVSSEVVFKIYQWQNSDGSNMQISFTNNHVDMKAQAGLK